MLTTTVREAEAFRPPDVRLGESLDKLAWLAYRQGRYQRAQALERRGLAIREKSLGPDHPATLASRTTRASVLRKLGRLAEANELDAQVKAAREAAAAPVEASREGKDAPR